jgi:hypothetical protein
MVALTGIVLAKSDHGWARQCDEIVTNHLVNHQAK